MYEKLQKVYYTRTYVISYTITYLLQLKLQTVIAHMFKIPFVIFISTARIRLSRRRQYRNICVENKYVKQDRI